MPQAPDLPKDLNGLLLYEIDRLGKESDGHKLLFRRIQFLIIAFTALSSVSSGLVLLLPEGMGAKSLQFLVLVITTLVTALTAYGELRHGRELWQHEREIFYALKDLHREFIFLQSLNELSVDKQHGIFERVQSVLGSSTGQWAGIHAPKTDKPERAKSNS